GKLVTSPRELGGALLRVWRAGHDRGGGREAVARGRQPIRAQQEQGIEEPQHVDPRAQMYWRTKRQWYGECWGRLRDCRGNGRAQTCKPRGRRGCCDEDGRRFGLWDAPAGL